MRAPSARPAYGAAALAAVVLIAGVVATLVVRSFAAGADESRRAEVFAEQADDALDGMEAVVEAYLDDLSDVTVFAGTLDPPGPGEFQRFISASGTLDEFRSRLLLYIEQVPAAELDAVVAREAGLRGTRFEPMTARRGEDLQLIMRSGRPEAGVDVPPADIGMVPEFVAAMERTGQDRRPTLVDYQAVMSTLFGEDGLMVGPEVDAEVARRDLLARLGVTDQTEDPFGGFGVLSPVLDARGSTVGWVLSDALPENKLERFETNDVSVEAQLGDPSTGAVAITAPSEVADAEDRLSESRLLSIDGLRVELTVVDVAPVADGGISSIVLVVGLAATLLAVLATHFWRRTDLHADAMAEQLETTERRVNSDPLTGLPNRTGITRALGDLLAARSEHPGLVVVLFVDVDRLKVVNDSLGHVVGDEALVRIAQRFDHAVAERGVVGRFGGDEFVVVAGGLRDLGAAVALAQELLHSIERPIRTSDVELRMDASIGVAFARRDDHVDPDDLIRDADAAMYEAKRSGGGSYSVFDDQLRVEAVDRLVVEQSLGNAVEDREIETWFQPIVDVDGDRVAAMEALVRWRSPGDGVVPPDRFLPAALETGLIVPIGQWVLYESCLLASDLGAEGVSIAVNLSERELADPGFVDGVTAALDGHGLAGERLTLEISEDLMIDRLARSVELLRELRLRGIRLSIDDFGTGHSSLSYVKRLDMIAELKVDRSFVADIASSSADQAIVAAVMTMAHSLDIDVVAEGVETASQVATLRRLGVRLMQGYHFGQPQPRRASVDTVRRWRPSEAPSSG